MSIIDTEVVDAVGSLPNTQLVVLSISDHLEWGDQTNQHLLLLQNKINTYLRFIESGEIYTTFPAAIGKKFAIKIFFKYEPDAAAYIFLSKVESILSEAEIELQTELIPSN